MLAIVIPYYKINFFEATLQSLANQTNKQFKVYIGNDASMDDPTVLLEKYKSQFDFVYHKFEENLGSVSLVKQWNRCIALTEDEKWLMILGDDDVLGENVVAEFYKKSRLLETEKINVVRFASIIIDGSGKKTSKIYTHPVQEKATIAYYKHYIEVVRSSLSEYIFRRTSYKQYGFTDFPLAWHTDDKAWLDFTQCGILYTINNAVVQVRLSSENISGRTNNESFKRLARKLFLQDLICYKLKYFTKEQKIIFLFEYSVLIKELNTMTFKNVSLVFFNYVKMGGFFYAYHYLRKMYKAKS